ncbi:MULTISPECIES: hypothetical protein [Microbacterium]|uniref:hypothetical protein n=1 Tax=Microbacterium TaxID=33882 RepID=UPI00217E2B75|nr:MULTISPECIES: hypothetical protein [Microbacterium]UWF78225.1 hypothetical protein JSY13_04150 [Microbacterium neungamense]WCM56397.1 hypothetical protein JRG78_04155 [Microbacterium sp. EF45047]
MEWDHLFDDLEDQLAAEWEAERAALDAESERLRIAKLALRDRLRTIPQGAPVLLELADGGRLHGRMQEVGADWLALAAEAAPARVTIVPLRAVEAVGVDHGMLLATLEPDQPAPGIRERMTFGFMLRDLARRRIPVRLGLRSGDPRHGTIDRAGADHLDLALHDPGEPRRARAVRGHRMIPLDAVVWVRPEP